jgi:type II secretory pathway component GspD/PulD (secretin)
MVKHTFRLFVLILLLTASVASAPPAWGLTYATITDVSATQLTNSVQITVKADGILEWRPEEAQEWYGWMGTWGGKGLRVALRFPGARSSVANFTDVNMYPVNFVETYVPQDAAQGIGVCLVLSFFTESDYDVSASPDRQSVIITVKTQRTMEKKGATGAASAGSQKSGLDCHCENGLMTLQALKMSMLKVLPRVAKEAGLNIMVDDALAKRTVSLTLTDTKPEDVLQYIASAYGLALSKQGDIYMVCEGVPTDLATYRASGTQSFPMKFVRAQTASELLPTFLYSYAHVNAKQNAVVVSAPNQMLQKIERDLSKVDIAPPQVMVEAIAIETSSADDVLTALSVTGQSGNIGQFSLGNDTGDITYTTIGALPSDYQARLQALVASHKAKINAMPRMAVVNGQTADIFVGAQRFIRVEYFQYGTKNEKIQGVDVGTHITVTPWTGTNGEITATIAPEVSNIIELDRETGLPTLSTRRASTTVRVKDGETIMIGGLTQQQDYWSNRKIPILGDLPLIGFLGRSRTKNSTKSDLVILITPRVLTESGHLPDAGEESRIKQRMLPAPLQ